MSLYGNQKYPTLIKKKAAPEWRNTELKFMRKLMFSFEFTPIFLCFVDMLLTEKVRNTFRHLSFTYLSLVSSRHVPKCYCGRHFSVLQEILRQICEWGGGGKYLCFIFGSSLRLVNIWWLRDFMWDSRRKKNS